MQVLGALLTVLGLGFVYFIAAIPTGAALGLNAWLAALVAWIGYSSGAVVVALAGEPLRNWLMKRLRIVPNPDSNNLAIRAWKRFGLPALGLLAPVTIGPQAGALVAIALGAKRLPVVLAFSLGLLPWAIVFATLTVLGVHIAK